MQIRSGISLCLLACGLIHAQNNPTSVLLVLSKGDHTLAMVDVATGKVMARMPSGPDPHEVVGSTDGKFAYISNYGGGAYNTLTVVDLVAHKTLPVIDLGALRGPHGLAFEGGKVWFTAEAAKAIGSFDPATQKIDWIMGTGQDRTHMLYVTRDLKHIYTTNVSSATVTLMEKGASKGPPPGGPGGRGFGGPPASGGPPPNGQPPRPPRVDWEETVVPVGQGAEGFDVSPSGKELWAANAWDGTISVIDIAAKKVTATLSADVRGANRLKFTPDGKYVLVSDLGGPDLTVLDAGSRRVIKRIPIGHGAAGIEMAPDGSRAYVACTPDNYVAVIDLNALKLVDHINAGAGPDGMAWVSLQ
jgi:YVTN family beta-propeller protein